MSLVNSEIALGSVLIILLIMSLAVGLLAARSRLVPNTVLKVSVNNGQTMETKRGRKLLEVLHGAGIPIPAACGGSGTCGQCRVIAEGEGAGDLRSTERGLLSARERRDHVRLACQISLRGPVTVTVPAGVMSAETFTCSVVSNKMLAPLIRELVLALPESVKLDFRAGNFMLLTAPPHERDFSQIEIDADHELTWRVSGWSGLSSAATERTSRARRAGLCAGHNNFQADCRVGVDHDEDGELQTVRPSGAAIRRPRSGQRKLLLASKLALSPGAGRLTQSIGTLCMV